MSELNSKEMKAILEASFGRVSTNWQGPHRFWAQLDNTKLIYKGTPSNVTVRGTTEAGSLKNLFNKLLGHYADRNSVFLFPDGSQKTLHERAREMAGEQEQRALSA